MRRGIAEAEVDRWEPDGWSSGADRLVVEEPCEIRLEGEAVAVTMRTPGHDAELAAGFLYTEGIVEPDDILSIRGCDRIVRRPGGNVVRVRLVPGRTPRRGWQRNFYAASSCGVCGKASIDAVRVHAAPVTNGTSVPRDLLAGLGDRLRERQRLFDATGGLHAAGLYSASGEELVVREDVGRHNAVDKAIGWALTRDALPLDHHVLVVSGRASFEIVQKALVARIPTVVAVSAASSLAVDLARESDMTLVGFLRESRLVVYTGADRIDGAPGYEGGAGNDGRPGREGS